MSEQHPRSGITHLQEFTRLTLHWFIDAEKVGKEIAC